MAVQNPECIWPVLSKMFVNVCTSYVHRDSSGRHGTSSSFPQVLTTLRKTDAETGRAKVIDYPNYPDTFDDVGGSNGHYRLDKYGGHECIDKHGRCYTWGAARYWTEPFPITTDTNWVLPNRAGLTRNNCRYAQSGTDTIQGTTMNFYHRNIARLAASHDFGTTGLVVGFGRNDTHYFLWKEHFDSAQSGGFKRYYSVTIAPVDGGVGSVITPIYMGTFITSITGADLDNTIPVSVNANEDGMKLCGIISSLRTTVTDSHHSRLDVTSVLFEMVITNTGTPNSPVYSVASAEVMAKSATEIFSDDSTSTIVTSSHTNIGSGFAAADFRRRDGRLTYLSGDFNLSYTAAGAIAFAWDPSHTVQYVANKEVNGSISLAYRLRVGVVGSGETTVFDTGTLTGAWSDTGACGGFAPETPFVGTVSGNAPTGLIAVSADLRFDVIYVVKAAGAITSSGVYHFNQFSNIKGWDAYTSTGSQTATYSVVDSSIVGAPREVSIPSSPTFADKSYPMGSLFIATPAEVIVPQMGTISLIVSSAPTSNCGGTLGIKESSGFVRVFQAGWTTTPYLRDDTGNPLIPYDLGII